MPIVRTRTSRSTALGPADWATIAFVGLFAFVPSRARMPVFGLPTPLFAVGSALIILAVLPLPLAGGDRRALRRPAILFTAVLMYATAGVLLRQPPFPLPIYILPLVLAFLAMFTAYELATKSVTLGHNPAAAAFRFSSIITASMVYFAVYRPAYAIDGRLATPLGGAADVHVALCLTMAAYFGCARVGYRRWPSLFLAGTTLVIVILTGSRAGFATAIAITALVALDVRRPARSASLLALYGTVLVIALRMMPSDRLGQLNDVNRQGNFDTSMYYLHHASFLQLIFGTGSGSVWPWFGFEQGFLSIDSSGLIATPYGEALANPHSVILGTLVELGVVGFALTLWAILSVLKHILIVWRSKSDPFAFYLLLGIVCTLPSFAVNYYLFKGFPVAAVWWYFSFLAIRLVTADRQAIAESTGDRVTNYGRRQSPHARDSEMVSTAP